MVVTRRCVIAAASLRVVVLPLHELPRPCNKKRMIRRWRFARPTMHCDRDDGCDALSLHRRSTPSPRMLTVELARLPSVLLLLLFLLQREALSPLAGGREMSATEPLRCKGWEDSFKAIVLFAFLRHFWSGLQTLPRHEQKAQTSDPVRSGANRGQEETEEFLVKVTDLSRRRRPRPSHGAALGCCVVQWKNEEERTWEPCKSLSDCHDAIQQFLRSRSPAFSSSSSGADHDLPWKKRRVEVPPAAGVAPRGTFARDSLGRR
jgi:hypothetical protein